MPWRSACRGSTVLVLALGATMTAPAEPPSSPCHRLPIVEPWFAPDRRRVDNATLLLDDPASLVEVGVDPNDLDAFEANAQRVRHVGDLNDDRRLDVITYWACVGGGGCAHSIYIGCGEGRYGMLWDGRVYAFDLRVLEVESGGWRVLQTLGEESDSHSLFPGRNVRYEFLEDDYRPTQGEEIVD